MYKERKTDYWILGSGRIFLIRNMPAQVGDNCCKGAD